MNSSDPNGSSIRAAGPKRKLVIICATYLILSGVFGSVNLDVDEFGFIKEPYELIGGDYTTRYLGEGELALAARTAARSYYFYWKYRPLFSPVIDEADKNLFRAEEVRFGYAVPPPIARATDPDRVAEYSKRLVVPEPERFYKHGAGKPLLPALLSIPQLALVQLLSSGPRSLVVLQHTHNYHPLFILTRLAQILAGLATILLIYGILAREFDTSRALLGASIMAFFPLSIRYFPNLHHDAFLVPFALLTGYYFSRQRYWVAGVFFGLALASKNTAIFLAPAMLAYVVWDAYSARQATASREVQGALARGIRGWGVVLLCGGLVLLPFASPLSSAQEILTPITHRPYDPRGGAVVNYSVSARLQAPKDTPKKYALRSQIRPEVRLLNIVSGFRDTGFLFLALAVICLMSRQNGPLARISFLVLLLAVPYGLVHGHTLSYRALMFVPFFAILAVDVGRRGPLLSLVAVLLLIDVVYCLDPMTVDTMHFPANKETFISALF